MATAYSVDLRVRALADCDLGMSARDVADKYSVSAHWVRKIKRIRKETGLVGPRPQRVSHATKLDDHLVRLLEIETETPDATLAEIVARFAAEGVKTSISGVHRALRRLKYSRKKKVRRASEQKRPDVRRQREEWRAEKLQTARGRLSFLDETAARTDMTRRYGRAPIGQRLTGYAPQSHWITTTFVAALRSDGLTAPLTIDGAMNGAKFQDYVEHVLRPTLRPGDIVVMDNLKCHKNAAVRKAIEAADAEVLYLPPYSPDLNPIEQAFSKLKQILRTAAKRTVAGLHELLDNVTSRFPPAECERYIEHCGYGRAS